MAFEVIRSEDLRAQFTHIAQGTYPGVTATNQTNLNAGKSFRPKSATIGEISVVRAEEGAMAFTGHEWPDGAGERHILRDCNMSLPFAMNSWLVGLAAALFASQVTSVQEGATGHYTHTSRPTNPLAGSGVRQVKVIPVYIDTGSADAGRIKRLYPSMALAGFSVSSRRGEMIQMAMDLVGSGKYDEATAITLVALSSQVLFSGQAMKVEYGAKGGALTDITERIREVSLRFTQNLALPEGYVPNATTPADGKFRSMLWFTSRQASIQMGLFVNRANRDLIDDMLSLTNEQQARKELKFTFDSGIVAGTGTSNHKLTVRFPDVRISETPVGFEDNGAVYSVGVSENQVYRDVAVADSPFTIITDNDFASYLV